MAAFIESIVEDAAFAWLENIGYAVKHGPEIVLSELQAPEVVRIREGHP